MMRTSPFAAKTSLAVKVIINLRQGRKLVAIPPAVSEPRNADPSALGGGPFYNLAHSFDGMHDQGVTYAKADVLSPVLELIRANHLFNVRIAFKLERLGLGLENRTFILGSKSIDFLPEIKGYGLERRMSRKGDRQTLVQLVHVVNDALNLRASIVDIGSFDSVDDIDQRFEPGVVLELTRQLLLELRCLSKRCVSVMAD